MQIKRRFKSTRARKHRELSNKRYNLASRILKQEKKVISKNPNQIKITKKVRMNKKKQMNLTIETHWKE